MATWRHFGFDHTPFSTNHLEPVESGPDSYRLFVGRDVEVDRLVTKIENNSQGSRQVVEGSLGGGKTSLLTVAKVRLSKETENRDAYFVPLEHVRIKTDYNFEKLAQDIVESIVATATSPAFQHEIVGDSVLGQTIAWFKGGKDRQGGFNVGWFGVQGGQSTFGPFVEPRINWLRILRSLTEELGGMGYEGVVLHINNLETMVERAPIPLERLLHDARDLFQVPGCHFVFVAPPGFTSNVVSRVEALRSIIPTIPLAIEPLNDAEFARAVERRLDRAKSGEKFVSPTTVDVARQLYLLTGGSLRGTFQIIETWAEQLPPTAIHTAETLDELVSALKPLFLAEIKKLPAREQEVLRAAVTLGYPFRQRGIQRLMQVQQSNLSIWMNKLEEKRYIVFQYQDGASKWYRLDERALLAFAGEPVGPGGYGGEPMDGIDEPDEIDPNTPTSSSQETL